METEQSITLAGISVIRDQTQELSKQLDEILNDEDALSGTNLTKTQSSGISLLDLKNQIMTSYLHNLVNLIIFKISESFNHTLLPSSDQPASHVLPSSDPMLHQLVWLRLVFEKMRPMEARLKYQIVKLLKTIEELDQNPQAEAIDHIVNDPLSFKPNPAALEAPDDDSDDAKMKNKQGDDSLEARRKQKEDPKSKEIYRPPRIAPVAFPEATKKSKRAAPAPIGLREHVSLSTNEPALESTTGLSNTAAKASNRAKALARMNEYEEANMSRLFSTKKEARRRRQDEAAIALGLETSSSNRNQKRKLGALEGEFDHVLNEISSKSHDRYSYHLGPSSRPPVAQKPKPGPSHLHSRQSHSSQQKHRKLGAFDKAVKKSHKK